MSRVTHADPGFLGTHADNDHYYDDDDYSGDSDDDMPPLMDPSDDDYSKTRLHLRLPNYD